MKAFTKEKYDSRIVWETKKVRQLFPLKEQVPYPSCKSMTESILYKKNYIGKTKKNVITHWNDHENLNKHSEPTKHLFQHPDHVFQWKVLVSGPMNNS